MKRSRFTQDQIIGILKEHQAGASAVDLCRKHGISDAMFYTWRSKYGGMEVSEARQFKALEEKNANLKRRLAESVMDVSTLKELLAKNSCATPGLQREAVTWAIRGKDYSQRRACRHIDIDPKIWHYASRRLDDKAVRARLRETGGRAAPVRVSAAAHPARPRRDRHEPQEAISAVSRGGSVGPQAGRSETGAVHALADGAARRICAISSLSRRARGLA